MTYNTATTLVIFGYSLFCMLSIAVRLLCSPLRVRGSHQRVVLHRACQTPAFFKIHFCATLSVGGTFKGDSIAAGCVEEARAVPSSLAHRARCNPTCACRHCSYNCSTPRRHIRLLTPSLTVLRTLTAASRATSAESGLYRCR